VSIWSSQFPELEEDPESPLLGLAAPEAESPVWELVIVPDWPLVLTPSC
jgi:hypothetical protein